MSQFAQFIRSLSPSEACAIAVEEHTENTENTENTEKVEELTFEKIKSELETRYKLKVKWYKDLFIITYPKRGTHASEDVDYSDPLVIECRGLIVNRNAPFNVVCKGFDMLEPTENIPDDLLTRDEGKITTTIDGSYIRVYYNSELKRWCVATNRCIEAKKARWHSYRTFFDYFQDASRSEESLLDYNLLNENRVYLFVVCHPENRIVRAYTSPMLYHIGTVDRTDGWKEVENDNIGIPHPPQIDRNFEGFDSVESVRDYVNTLDWQTPGYVVQWRGSNGSIKRSKLRNAEYERINELRGDNRSSVETLS